MLLASARNNSSVSAFQPYSRQRSVAWLIRTKKRRKLLQESAADTPDQRKRKHEERLKEKRKRSKGKATKQAASANIDYQAAPCPHCGSTSHPSSRSKDCPNHSKSSREILTENLTTKFRYHTRKAPFERIVRPEYQAQLLT